MQTKHRTLLLLLLLSSASFAHAGEFSTLLKERKFAEADRAVAARLAADPRNADALATKAELALTWGQDARIAEAVAAGEACVAAWPNNADCHQALGDALASRALAGSLWSAMSYAGRIRDSYLHAVTLDPKNFEARNSLMQFYLQAPAIAGGGKDKARDLVTDTARTDPEAGKLLRALLEAGGEKYQGAEAVALSANPGDSEQQRQAQRNVLATVAYHYIEDKKYDQAERVFRDVLKRWPESAAGLTGLARVAQAQGKSAEALAYYEKSVALDPRASTWYRMGQLLQSQQDKARALAAYEKALNARPALGKKQREEMVEHIKALKG
jgi:tetratricopeptide (TPR) repeat protein